MTELGASLSSKGAPTKLLFEDGYILDDPDNPFAKGSFGTVFSARHKLTGEEYAVKIIERSRLTSKDNESVLREVDVLRALTDVEHIVRLVDFYESPKRFYVVQIYAQGGDVFERLSSRTTYNEKQGRDLAIKLLTAMCALHERKLAHRDLKPENLLLKDLVDDTNILVADFGFAAYVPEGGLKTRCGTPAFVAPEVLVQNCRYDYSVDMWSVGCLLYMLIGGYPPFQDRNHRGLFRKIRGADYCFHDVYWKNVSVPAKQLIANLLTTDPKYRLTAKDALEKSRWLQMDKESLEANDLSASLTEIKKFKARQSLKGAMHAVLWSVRSNFKSTSDTEFSKQVNDWDKDDEERDCEALERVDNALLTKLRPTLKFEDVYELKQEIHKSQTATICECVHKQRGDVLAVKIIGRKSKPSTVTGKTTEEAVLHELAVLKALKHKYIIEVIDFFETDENFFLVMERMDGGDVFDRILKTKQYTEKDARDLAKILLEAVKHMHGERIVHRDLKPQNLLLKSVEDNADIKIADFGFACRVHTPQSLTTRCGTPTYVAPEILKNIPYDQSVDMWSVGVIIYVLLCGYPPFANENQSLLFQSIRMGEYEFNDQDWSEISEEAKEVVKNLLVVDPHRRWTAEQALESAWLKQDAEQLSSKDLSDTVQATVKKRRMRFKNVARTIMWLNKSKSSDKEDAPTSTEDAEQDAEPERDDDQSSAQLF